MTITTTLLIALGLCASITAYYSNKRKTQLRNWNIFQKRIAMVTFFGIMGFFKLANATVYLECSSLELKSCTKELTKGESITLLATNPKAKVVKIDYVKFDTDKGTLKVDKK